MRRPTSWLLDIADESDVNGVARADRCSLSRQILACAARSRRSCSIAAPPRSAAREMDEIRAKRVPGGHRRAHMHGNCRPLAAASSRRADVQSFHAFGHCERRGAPQRARGWRARRCREAARAGVRAGGPAAPQFARRQDRRSSRSATGPKIHHVFVALSVTFACPDALPGLRSWPADGLASAHCGSR